MTQTEPSPPHARRGPISWFKYTFGRFVRVMLDVKPRWWLALWFWLPVGLLIFTLSMTGQSRLGNTVVTYSDSFFVETHNDTYQIAESPREALCRLSITIGCDIRPTRWRMDLSYTIRGLRDSASEAEQVAAATLGDAVTRTFDHLFVQAQPEDVRAWAAQTGRELAAAGGGTRDSRPPLSTLAAYFGYGLIRWLTIVGFGLSVLHWLLSGMQIGAYKRMLRRHESGRCPDCDYDITAHPNAICPECGCDHRVRRQEAIRSLRGAKQWPLEDPLPSAP